MSASGRRFPAARAPVSLRDGIVALAELRPADDSSQQAILELLGLTRAAVSQDAPATVAPPVSPESRPAAGAAPGAAAPPATASPATTPRPAQPLPTHVVRKQGLASVQPAWKTPGAALPPASKASEPAPLPAIFPPLEGRGIYTAALSTRVPEGEPDLDHAVNELAHYRPLRELPRLPLRTLRRGVQLLLDTGPSMAPYAADVHALADELATLLSGAQLERLYFMRCPRRGVRESLRARGRTWPVPPRGMPVLAVSDFGIADNVDDEDAASVEEWRRFADEVRAEGHPLIGHVPFAASRWPAALTDVITLIHWSERTIASSVDRALREAQRRFR